MSKNRHQGLRAGGRHLALAGMAVTFIACAVEAGSPENLAEVEQELAACSFSITTNTYVGADYWGTIKFKNTGATAMSSPQIAFNVPSGVVCDYDEPGWTHTQSGSTCTYSRTSGLTVAAGASYTFYYSTTSNTSFTATNIQISDPSCGGSSTTSSTTSSSGSGGSGGAGGSGGSGGAGGSGGSMTANQKKVAEALTSIWENDTPTINYAYSENIYDGRGYTNGRAGFCTGTGDAIMVIQCYNNRRSQANGNLMTKYMPGLTTINNRFLSTGESQESTSELDVIGNWTADWATSYNSSTTRADFKACQDQINDNLYFTPAMNEAAKWGLVTALSKAALYDAFINHGEWGAKNIIKSANEALGNWGQVAPAVGYNGITESSLLQKFLEKRRDILAADSTWIEAVDRVAAYEKQRRKGNWDFATALRNDVRAQDCWGAAYPASGYTVRAINPDGTWSTPSSYAYSCN